MRHTVGCLPDRASRFKRETKASVPPSQSGNGSRSAPSANTHRDHAPLKFDSEGRCSPGPNISARLPRYFRRKFNAMNKTAKISRHTFPWFLFAAFSLSRFQSRNDRDRWTQKEGYRIATSQLEQHRTAKNLPGQSPATAGWRSASQTSAKGDGETRCGWEAPAVRLEAAGKNCRRDLPAASRLRRY